MRQNAEVLHFFSKSVQICELYDHDQVYCSKLLAKVSFNNRSRQLCTVVSGNMNYRGRQGCPWLPLWFVFSLYSIQWQERITSKIPARNWLWGNDHPYHSSIVNSVNYTRLNFKLIVLFSITIHLQWMIYYANMSHVCIYIVQLWLLSTASVHSSFALIDHKLPIVHSLYWKSTLTVNV